MVPVMSAASRSCPDVRMSRKLAIVSPDRFRIAAAILPSHLGLYGRRRYCGRPDDLEFLILNLQEADRCRGVLEAIELHRAIDGVEGLGVDDVAQLRLVEARLGHGLLEDLAAHVSEHGVQIVRLFLEAADIGIVEW